MDKMGMFWGGAFGGVWGFLYFSIGWPYAETIVNKIDMWVKYASNASLVDFLGGGVILALLCGGIGILLGGMAGTGRKGW